MDALRDALEDACARGLIDIFFGAFFGAFNDAFIVTFIGKLPWIMTGGCKSRQSSFGLYATGELEQHRIG